MSDLISRKELLEEIKCYQMDIVSKATAIKVINRQPPVEAVPVVHGEWERIPYSFASGYRCSCCGTKSVENHWNFCPNCGADMRKKVK